MTFRNRKIVLILAASLSVSVTALAFTVYYFFPTPTVRSPIEEFAKSPDTQEVTFGDSSYILFRPQLLQYAENVLAQKQVLVAKQAFKNQHPDLEVTGWQVDTCQCTVYGIYVDHKPSGKQPLTRDHVVPK